MVAANRTLICVALALASAACGVVLPAPEDADSMDPGAKDPVTTKGANLPAPGANGDAGGASDGSPGTPGADASTAPPSPARIYRVFVTSQIWPSDDIGGLSGADAKCSTLASMSPLLQNKKWAAWLSAGTSAIARLGATPGPWIRVDGVTVAGNRAQLVDRLLPLYAAISIDEQGSPHDDSVWTGTLANGGDTADDTCNGWSGVTGRGVFGRIDFAKPNWTEAGDVECDGDSWGESGGGANNGWSSWPRNRLYCFEID